MAEPTQTAAAHSRTFVVRQLTCQFVELGIRLDCQLIDGINLNFGANGCQAVATRYGLHNMRSLYFLMRTLLFHQSDMEAIRAAEHFRHLADRSGIYGFLERINETERTDPTQLTMRFFYARVGRYFRCHCHKILLQSIRCTGFLTFAFYDFFAGRHALAGVVDTSQCLRNRCRIGTHRALDGYMCYTAVNFLPLVRTEHQSFHSIVVGQIFGSSLCTITLQFFDKRSRRIYTAMLGLGHFQLEVNEQIQILIQRLLAAGGLLTVFLIDVLELRQHHRLTVDGHQHFVLLRANAQHAQRQYEC